VIERVTPADAGTPVSPREAAFRHEEVAQIEIYEETPHKKAVLRGSKNQKRSRAGYS